MALADSKALKAMVEFREGTVWFGSSIVRIQQWDWKDRYICKNICSFEMLNILLDSSIANMYRYIWTRLLFVLLNGLAMHLCFNSVWSLRFGLPYREIYSRYLRPWQVSLLWNHRKDWRASHRQCLLGPRLSGKRGLMLKEALLFCYVGTELSYSPLQILKWKYLPEALWLEIFGSSTNTFIILGLNTITRY